MMVARWACVFVASVLGGCVYFTDDGDDVDFAGFACNAEANEEECPDGFACIDGRCEAFALGGEGEGEVVCPAGEGEGEGEPECDQPGTCILVDVGGTPLDAGCDADQRLVLCALEDCSGGTCEPGCDAGICTPPTSSFYALELQRDQNSLIVRAGDTLTVRPSGDVGGPLSLVLNADTACPQQLSPDLLLIDARSVDDNDVTGGLVARITVGSLIVEREAAIVVDVPAGVPCGALAFIAERNILIDGTISVAGNGGVAGCGGFGGGETAVGLVSSGRGGSHATRGVDQEAPPFGGPHIVPLRGGGGGGSDDPGNPAAGGAGGGVLALYAVGAVTVNGSIDARGGDASGGGGGAGGSVVIEAGFFFGGVEGQINVEGGRGSGGGDPGGMGRVRVATENPFFDGEILPVGRNEDAVCTAIFSQGNAREEHRSSQPLHRRLDELAGAPALPATLRRPRLFTGQNTLVLVGDVGAPADPPDDTLFVFSNGVTSSAGLGLIRAVGFDDSSGQPVTAVVVVFESRSTVFLYDGTAPASPPSFTLDAVVTDVAVAGPDVVYAIGDIVFAQSRSDFDLPRDVVRAADGSTIVALSGGGDLVAVAVASAAAAQRGGQLFERNAEVWSTSSLLVDFAADPTTIALLGTTTVIGAAEDRGCGDRAGGALLARGPGRRILNAWEPLEDGQAGASVATRGPHTVIGGPGGLTVFATDASGEELPVLVVDGVIDAVGLMDFAPGGGPAVPCVVAVDGDGVVYVEVIPEFDDL